MAAGSDVNYWTIVTIVGPLVLVLVIAWAIIRNRRSGVSEETTEEGTRQVYRDEQREHQDEPGSGL
jgi:flagellar biosynthesis/type III secretory pathway M-ring protein FliF/YscJ